MSRNYQMEMPLPVAVCAWCRPNERGNGIGALSHGICLKHLRKFRLEMQKMSAKKNSRSARRKPKPKAYREPLSLL
jgi:hypothetical protein